MLEGSVKTVFVVDDDTFLLDIYAARFTEAGYNVLVAQNGAIALEKIHAGCVPDVMLIDVVMPTLDGFELVEKLNQEKLLSKTLKIFLSNLGQEEDIAKGKSLGAVGYIIKASSTPSEIVEAVRNILLKNNGL